MLIQVDGLSMEERLQLVQQLLTAEGFQIEWEHQGEQYLIREINCPYYHIGQNHPEVCVIDQTLIATLLGMPHHQSTMHAERRCTLYLSLKN